jgi:hypothetical protein
MTRQSDSLTALKQGNLLWTHLRNEELSVRGDEEETRGLRYHIQLIMRLGKDVECEEIFGGVFLEELNDLGRGRHHPLFLPQSQGPD